MSSAASPLPHQLVPLLQGAVDKLKDVIVKILPDNKKRTALEEAEWEDEGGEGALQRELMLQCVFSWIMHEVWSNIFFHQPWKRFVSTALV